MQIQLLRIKRVIIVLSAGVDMYKNWVRAYESFNWVVDLSNYSEKEMYPDHFNAIIDLYNLSFLEKRFQEAISNPASNFDGRIVAGEILFWKLNSRRNASKNTSNLIRDLSYQNQNGPIVWRKFAYSLSALSKEPTLENFDSFCSFCNMNSGYAVPITFLSFYNPTEYPIADRRIAKWWQYNKDKFGYNNSSNFILNEDGSISGLRKFRKANWNSYLKWVDFCKDYAKKLSFATNTNWNARKVEIAVWSASGSEDILLKPL